MIIVSGKFIIEFNSKNVLQCEKWLVIVQVIWCQQLVNYIII